MAELLWPDADYPTRAARLRWLLAKLRALGIPLENGSAELFLRTRDVSVDVEDVDEIRPDAIGAVLPGYTPDFSPRFAAWLDDQRSVLSAAIVRKLIPRLRRALDRGDWTATESIAHGLLRVDELNEDAALALAEAHCRVGARAAAMTGLERYLERLGERPSEAHVRARVFLERIRSVGSSSRPSEPRFVGRREELQRIDELLRAARKGRGGALILTGPAGIGKTRLLDEASIRARLAGMQVVRIRCQRGSAVRSLSGIIELIPQLLELRGAAGCDPINLDRLQGLTQVETGDARDVRDSVSPSLRRSQLVTALLDLIDAVSSESALLVEIDDVQWADPALGWLWDRILAWSGDHDVCWLFGHRTTRRDSVAIGAPSIGVGSLDEGATNELLDDLAGQANRHMDPASREALMARGGGSPLFLRELTRQWGATGRCHELPGSLIAIFDTGLASLNRYALRTLQVAAVLDTYATLERIECVAELPRGTFIDAIADLEASGILTADARGSTYGHVLWAEAALSRLSRNVAKIIHRHAAERLRDELADGPSLSMLWECARHWDRAGHPDRARSCVVQGAEHLAENGFVIDAARAYRGVIQQAGDPAERLAFLRRRIELLRTAARWSELGEEIDKHEQLAVELNPAYDEHNELEIMRIHLSYDIGGDLANQMRHALRCALDPRGSSAHRLNAAKVCAKSADLVSPATLRLVADVARDIPRTTDEARWDGALTQLMYELRLGDRSTAVSIAESLASTAWHSEVHRGHALTACGEAYAIAGRITEAKASLEEGIRLSTRMGWLASLVYTYDCLIGIALDLDPLATTRTLLDESWQAIKEIEMTSGIVSEFVFPSHEAQLAVLQGDATAALKWAMPLEKCMNLEAPSWRIRLLAIHAAALSQLGKRDLVREVVRHMTPCFAEPDRWFDWPASVYASCLACDDPEDAARFASRYIHSFRRELYPPPNSLIELAAHASVDHLAVL
ncbi:MAG: hypothetical protein JWM41_3546 [Gemmatimonadetes bacterium]|nr:hypothetical protein [Gemmatimonadota bacterium]